MPYIQTAFWGRDEIIFQKEVTAVDNTFIQDMSEILHLTDDDCLSIFKPRRVGPSDFSFAVIERKNGAKSFVKIAGKHQVKEKLQNEGGRAGATEIAAALGYPTLTIKRHFCETRGGIGICEFEYLDFTEGKEIVNSLESRMQISPSEGIVLADIIAPRVGIAIPPELDISSLKDLDESYGTKENFFKSFHYDCSIVLQSMLPDRTGIARSQLKDLFQEVQRRLFPLVEQGEQSNIYYFCGNDITPSNMFFPYKPEAYEGKKVIFYDWEWAGKTRNEVLAFIVDMRTLIRFRPNIPLQEAFIRSIFRCSTDLVRTYHLLRSGVISQTAFDAKINVLETSPYYDHALDALRSLPLTLQLIDIIYQESKQL